MYCTADVKMSWERLKKDENLTYNKNASYHASSSVVQEHR